VNGLSRGSYYRPILATNPVISEIDETEPPLELLKIPIASRDPIDVGVGMVSSALSKHVDSL
jgi:hypothetical protein